MAKPNRIKMRCCIRVNFDIIDCSTNNSIE